MGFMIREHPEAVIAKTQEILAVKTEIAELMSYLKNEAAKLTGGFGHSSTDSSIRYEHELNSMCYKISQTLEMVTAYANELEETATCYTYSEPNPKGSLSLPVSDVF